MAEDLNTLTTPTVTDPAPAPAGGAQVTPEEVTPPTAEQRTAFQRFMDSLFGGKNDTPAEKDGAPGGEAPKQEPEAKTYTEADLQERLKAEKAAWAAEQEEKARLAKLSPEERAKAEDEAKDKRLSDLEAQLRKRDLRDTALAQLEKEGFPTGLADLLIYNDQESMEKSLASVQGIFKASLEAAVKDRLRGKTPEGLGGAATTENALKDQIAKNIRGGLN